MSEPIVFIPLTQGKVAVVDFGDFGLVRSSQWSACMRWNGKTYEAVTAFRKGPGKWTQRKMHSVITGWPRVDHRNGNPLDNRRCNLRQFSQAQNLRAHISPRTNRSSRYRGVTWYNASPYKWKAQITFNYKAISIGYFDSEEDAARAYDAAAIKFGFSEEALNFPPPRPADFEIL